MLIILRCYLQKKIVKIDYTVSTTFSTIFQGYNKIEKNTNIYGFLGKGSYIGSGSTVVGYVGKFCSIGVDVLFISGTHPINLVSTHPSFYSIKNQALFSFVKSNKEDETKKITYNGKLWNIVVENDVWIGSRAVINPGIRIGNGAIILANSVVTKNVEPYQIVGGVPAKVIKFRHNKSEIDLLLKSRWWDKSFEEIKSASDFFNNPGKFIEAIKNINNV